MTTALAFRADLQVPCEVSPKVYRRVDRGLEQLSLAQGSVASVVGRDPHPGLPLGKLTLFFTDVA